ncbi:MAG: hypothetical protein K6F05_09170 [Succinivibrio sp.]|nr:hypothetical protein [Succinivibrio sp.]
MASALARGGTLVGGEHKEASFTQKEFMENYGLTMRTTTNDEGNKVTEVDLDQSYDLDDDVDNIDGEGDAEGGEILDEAEQKAAYEADLELLKLDNGYQPLDSLVPEENLEKSTWKSDFIAKLQDYDKLTDAEKQSLDKDYVVQLANYDKLDNFETVEHY